MMIMILIKGIIIISDNEKLTCMLIDVISGDRNVSKKEAEKIIKDKNLTTNTAHVECKIKKKTVTLGPAGTITKLLWKYLSNTTEKHELKEF